MFTGIVEKLCIVKLVQRSSNSIELAVDLDNLANECKIGDSIAINGVCLTITKINKNIAYFDISGETISKSTLGKLQISSQVNIERAMKANDRFGGHFVLGHIDGTSKIERIQKNDQFADIKFSADKDLIKTMVLKGSVAIDGISLTISNLDKASFNIVIIPQTLNNTTLKNAKVGDIVNIETDLLIKAVKKQLDNILPDNGNLTAEKLWELGF